MLRLLSVLLSTVLLSGCATTLPRYYIRPAPLPNQAPDVVNLERQISAQQAQLLESQAALYDTGEAHERGFGIEGVVRRIASVSERPNLYYRVYVLGNSDPNAAALADGRLYISLGMLDYLKDRGGREDELAFIIAHEIAHTCAQHQLKNVQQLQEQQARANLWPLLGVLLVASYSDPYSPYYTTDMQTANLAGQALANLVNAAQSAGFSQDQELEADQLAVRYMLKAGYQSEAAVALTEDFQRFDYTGTFLRTHPLSPRRAEDLRRSLVDAARPRPPGIGLDSVGWETVRFESNPSGASVTVNDQWIGQTPISQIWGYLAPEARGGPMTVKAYSPQNGKTQIKSVRIPPVPSLIYFNFVTGKTVIRLPTDPPLTDEAR